MKHVHFLGIAGSGASAVAAIAKAQGFEVSGCDLNTDGEFIADFDKSFIFKGHSKEHIENMDILAITPAIISLDPKNEEIEEAKKNGIEVLTWQEFMGKYLEKDKFVIAVCGTHGKSTVTAMAANLLEDAKLDPTVELGATLPKWGKNFRTGKSKYFVTESDEFNDNFLVSHPDILIVTNIEMDHPEYFEDFDHYKRSFLKLFNQTKSLIIANFQDPGVREVLKAFQRDKEKKFDPKIIDYSKSSIEFPLRVSGEFNKINATAVFQLGIHLNIDPSVIQKSLMGYQGLSRRSEYIGEHGGAKIFSDFGHHPTEIKNTIDSFRQKYLENRIVLIYEPHMFSRTKFLFDKFVKVFRDADADQIFIIDIYPSREVDTGIISAKELTDAINKRTVSYLGPKEEVLDFLKIVIRRGDIVLFMGAGDIDKMAKKVVSSK